MTKGRYCVVSCCENNNWKNAEESPISFHKFPKNKNNIRQKWLEIIQKVNRDPGFQIKNENTNCICRQHFGEGDISESNRIKDHAVPRFFNGNEIFLDNTENINHEHRKINYKSIMNSPDLNTRDMNIVDLRKGFKILYDHSKSRDSEITNLKKKVLYLENKVKAMKKKEEENKNDEKLIIFKGQ